MWSPAPSATPLQPCWSSTHHLATWPSCPRWSPCFLCLPHSVCSGHSSQKPSFQNTGGILALPCSNSSQPHIRAKVLTRPMRPCGMWLSVLLYFLPCSLLSRSGFLNILGKLLPQGLHRLSPLPPSGLRLRGFLFPHLFSFDHHRNTHIP